MTAGDSALPDLAGLYAHHHGWLRSWLSGRLGCNFPLGDSDEALDLLAYALPVRVHRRWPGWIVIEPRPSP